jgi:hypothetical protein
LTSNHHTAYIRLFSKGLNDLSANGLVKGIGSSLALQTRGGSISLVALSNSGLVGIALVDELVADEAGDDTDVESRAVGEVGQVSSLEGILLATVRGDTEDNGGVGTASKVSTTSSLATGHAAGLASGTCRGSVGSGISLSSLRLLAVGLSSFASSLAVSSISGSSSISNSGLVGSSSSSGGGTSGTSSTSSGLDLSVAEVVDTEAKSVDAAGVVGIIIASVSGAGVVTDLTGCEGAGLVRKRRVTTDSSDLSGEISGDLLVERLGAIAGRVLVLLDGSDLRVDGLNGFAGN